MFLHPLYSVLLQPLQIKDRVTHQKTLQVDFIARLRYYSHGQVRNVFSCVGLASEVESVVGIEGKFSVEIFEGQQIVLGCICVVELVIGI